MGISFLGLLKTPAVMIAVSPPGRDGDHDSRGFEQPQEEIPIFIFLKLVIKLYIATCTRQ